VELLFKKNGASFGAMAFVPIGVATTICLNISCIVDLSIDDYMELFIYHDHGGDRIATAGDHINVMQITKII